MKELFIRIGYYLLALLELPLKGIVLLLVCVFYFVPLWLWDQWSYAAQCLRYPPPPGGMGGVMSRACRKSQESQKSENRQ